MPKKKKFVDKTKAVTFRLVHRSQHDPLVADETAPQRILVPTGSENSTKRNKNKEEEIKYGIHFDDDYDYLQHLRQINRNQVEWVQTPQNEPEKRKISLPSSIFASDFEEEIGLLNKAAFESGLRLDLDPDIVASMDEDFDYSNPNNKLEDNFIELAITPSSDIKECNEEDYYEENESDNEKQSTYSSEIRDEMGSIKNFDNRSQFTDYSMSSSVISRNSNLTLLDETFEQMFANYDESEIGALECDEIEGEIDSGSQIFKAAIDEFDRNRQINKLTTEELKNVMIDSSEESEPDDGYLFEVNAKENWDCDSILSTFSNTYYHPKLIKEPMNKIRVDKKTGIPMLSGKLTKKAVTQLDDSKSDKGPSSIFSMFSLLSIRDKNETPDEKKERKQQLRQYRKVRRMERKANTAAFKEEKKKLERAMMHNRSNLKGIVL